MDRKQNKNIMIKHLLSGFFSLGPHYVANDPSNFFISQNFLLYAGALIDFSHQLS